MSQEIHYWNLLAYFVFFGLPMLMLWANSEKNPEDNRYQINKDLDQSPIDLTKMGAS